ncbi:MAG: hypothetical protein K0U47_12115 [Epsilonproteobacteria bacterium]|nr:hypothetical protein [Campylobacterota bacterium]
MFTVSVLESTQLLSIIPEHPMTRLYHLSNGSLAFCQKLATFCKLKDYDYDLRLLDEKSVLDAQKRLQELPIRFSINLLNLRQQRYNRQSKEYDFVFVTIDLSQVENLTLLFKKLYYVVKSGGNLLLFVQKDRDNISALKALLEKHLYVAVNHLDLAENYDVISAKRMHGWGN